jgi:hypothetical protein
MALHAGLTGRRPAFTRQLGRASFPGPRLRVAFTEGTPQMLARIDNARALGQGSYDFEQRSYRYIDFYDPEGRDQVVRLMLDDDVPADFTADFGQLYTLVGELSGDTKVIRGTDRQVTQTKFRVHAIEAVASGKGRQPVAAVA